MRNTATTCTELIVCKHFILMQEFSKLKLHFILNVSKLTNKNDKIPFTLNLSL